MSQFDEGWQAGRIKGGEWSEIRAAIESVIESAEAPAFFDEIVKNLHDLAESELDTGKANELAQAADYLGRYIDDTRKAAAEARAAMEGFDVVKFGARKGPEREGEEKRNQQAISTRKKIRERNKAKKKAAKDEKKAALGSKNDPLRGGLETGGLETHDLSGPSDEGLKQLDDGTKIDIRSKKWKKAQEKRAKTAAKNKAQKAARPKKKRKSVLMS